MHGAYEVRNFVLRRLSGAEDAGNEAHGLQRRSFVSHYYRSDTVLFSAAGDHQAGMPILSAQSTNVDTGELFQNLAQIPE
jgi:hypothetical protein